MSAFAYFGYGVLLTAIFVTIQRYGLLILETFVSTVLETFNSGILPQSKNISGPKWRFPNGSILQRFLDGQASSEEWQKYGSVYRVWSGTHPEIVITTAKDFKHFGTDASDHGKPHNMNLGWFVGQVIGQCLGFHNDGEWTRMRNIFEPTFTHGAALARIEMVDSAARDYVEKLPGLATSSAGKEGEENFGLSVVDAFTKFPYFLTASTIYGPMSETEKNDLWDLTNKRNALLPYFLGGGPYRNGTTAWLFDRGSIKSLRAFESEWRDYNAQIVASRRIRGENPPILKFWEEYESGNQTLPELLQTIDELLMLNLDVIAHVLTWFITLVADDNQVQNELREEIASNQADLQHYITKSDTHLHRCFAESMRVRPFALFTPGEYSKQTKNFGGVLVKPGTSILLDVLAINVRNPFWGSDSAEFKPSRLKNVRPLDLRYNLHSFGIGSRKCMGQYTAGHIVKALVLHLFNEYDVVLADEKKAGDNFKVDKASWTPKATAHLQLTKRSTDMIGCP